MTKTLGSASRMMVRTTGAASSIRVRGSMAGPFVNTCVCTFLLTLIRAYACIGKSDFRRFEDKSQAMGALPKTKGADAGPAFQPDQTPCNCLALRQAAR